MASTSSDPMDILVLGGRVVTMDAAGTLIEDGAIAIRGTDIVEVGSATETGEKYRATARKVIGAAGHLIIPGLINLHTHGADSLFRGLIDDLPLEPWLEKLWRVEREFLTPESVAAGSRLAYAEMVRGGTTTALDMFWHPRELVRAARQIGLRLVTGPVWFDSEEIDGLRAAERPQQAREFIEEYHSDPLVTPCLLPHGTYTVSPDHLRQAQRLAEEFGALISTHCSETAAEVRTVHDRYQDRPPVLLDRLGILGPRTILAHCVHLDAQEIGLLAERQTIVAHCPLSNLKLGSGVAPLPEMRRAGVPIALGTDGPVSGNDLDMWLAMRLAAVVHKGVHQDPSLISARKVLAMATREAAAALGKAHEIGSLEPGKRADLVLVRLDRPHLVPLFDVYSHLVYTVGRGDVQTVLIHGREVLRDGHLATVDEQGIRHAVESLSERVQKANLI